MKEPAKIREYLRARGWTPVEHEPFRFESPDGDSRIDLSGRYGYVWDLSRFTDAGDDVPARGRYVDAGEGDTLDALVARLGAM